MSWCLVKCHVVMVVEFLSCGGLSSDHSDDKCTQAMIDGSGCFILYLVVVLVVVTSVLQQPLCEAATPQCDRCVFFYRVKQYDQISSW